MKVSIELTLMPLKDNFEEPIINFIKPLRNSGFKVLENPLSTQIFGDYDALMPLLTTEIKSAFNSSENIVLNLKMVKSDRSSYEPHF